MLYMAKTAHLQADESIHCSGIADVDAAITPWALLVLDEDEAAAETGWQLAGAYATETDALDARRQLSCRFGSGDYDAMAPSLVASEQLEPSDARHWSRPIS